MIVDKVIEIPFKISSSSRESIIHSVETSIALLSYVKPKLRTLVVPGNINDLPDEIPGGLFKATQTPEGTLYTSGGSGPGIQIESNIYTDSSSVDLFKDIYNKIIKLHNKKTNEILPSYHHSWFFINPPSETESNFHDHSKFNSTFPHDIPSYTWTYYIQLPNNCKGTDGLLSFKQDSLIETIDVKLDTLYIFPSTLLHQPNISPLSTLNRITAAGNILIPASEKSLLSE